MSEKWVAEWMRGLNLGVSLGGREVGLPCPECG